MNKQINNGNQTVSFYQTVTGSRHLDEVFDIDRLGTRAPNLRNSIFSIDDDVKLSLVNAPVVVVDDVMLPLVYVQLFSCDVVTISSVQ